MSVRKGAWGAEKHTQLRASLQVLSTTATGGLGYWKIGCRGSDPGLCRACAAPLAQPTPQPVKEFGAAPHAQAGLAPPPATRPPARLPLRRLTPWGPAGRPGQGRSVLASAAACPAAACRQWLAQASAFTFLAAAARFLAAASTMFTWPWAGRGGVGGVGSTVGG